MFEAVEGKFVGREKKTEYEGQWGLDLHRLSGTKEKCKCTAP